MSDKKGRTERVEFSLLGGLVLDWMDGLTEFIPVSLSHVCEQQLKGFMSLQPGRQAEYCIKRDPKSAQNWKLCWLNK